MPPRPDDRAGPSRASEANPPPSAPNAAANIVPVTSSGTAVAATSARDVIVTNVVSAASTAITGFTVGQDVLRIEDAAGLMAALTARITVSPDADGVSTDVIADAGTASVHTIAVLKGVLATDLNQLVQAPHEGELELSASSLTVAATTAADHIEIKSIAQSGDVVTGFTPGVDRLDLGPIDRAQLSLARNADGVSTDLVVGGGTTASHVLVTLKSVLTSDLTQVIGPAPVQPTPLAAPNATVAATGGADLFIVTSLTLAGDTIVGFTLGQDRLALVDGLDPSRLSLAKDADGTSTDVIVDAGGSSAHTLVKLAGVLTTDINAIFLHHEPHGSGWSV